MRNFFALAQLCFFGIPAFFFQIVKFYYWNLAQSLISTIPRDKLIRDEQEDLDCEQQQQQQQQQTTTKTQRS